MPCIRGILVEILYCNIRWRRIFECDLWYFSDVRGVEIAGALKNVLAIAAGIVEGMNLGNNCMAALVAQGCSEIRWLATKVCNIYHLHFHCLWSLKTCYIHWHQLLKLKMGAKPTTLSGLSGSGDIMLTCFVNLSRNRSVGLRLGSGEKLDEIMSSMNQVCSILCMTSIYAQYMTVWYNSINSSVFRLLKVYQLLGLWLH